MSAFATGAFRICKKSKPNSLNCAWLSSYNASMNAILNVSVYKFIDITDGQALKLAWQDLCDRFSVKGTILIAPEGVNIFLAAPRNAIESVLSQIKTDRRFRKISRLKKCGSD
jgi:predicted sulfurtransferase